MKNLLYIGNKLSGKGNTITVIETLSAHLQSDGYIVIAVSDYRNMVLRLLHMLVSVIRNYKSDYVLIDTYSTTGFWFAFCVSQLCRILGKKYIPILHGGNLPNRLSQNPKLCKMVFGNAYQNVAPSHYLLEAFKKEGYTNVVYIPNTFALEDYKYEKRSSIRPKLLWVRAFSKIYNPKMAVDVLYELQKKYPDAELCMVGPEKDGSLEATQSYAREKKVTVTFTGRLDKPDWIGLSEGYDIFINTTHFDNTPVSVMEAMALGLPVVSTNVGGIPYLLNDGTDGLLAADGEVSEMVAAIEKLIDDSQFSKSLSETARSKAETWDWQRVKQQWNALLR